MAQHEVIVGNIGYVYCGEDEANAKQLYYEYVDIAKALLGRASGESVVWMIDSEVAEEHVGVYPDEGE